MPRNDFVTVADLIAYLNTIPSDAVVELNVSGCSEYLELDDEEHIYYSSMCNTLFLGNDDY